MDEESRKALSQLSVDQLYSRYRAGGITAGRYNELIHAKAKIQTEDANLTNPADYVKMMWESSVKHFQEGWDNVIEAAQRKDSDSEKETPVLTDLYYAGLGAWGAFQMAMAPMTAFGEVNGEGARRLALGAGASPGAARYIGLGVDLLSGVVPAGKLAQGGARLVQSGAKSGLLGATMKKLSAAASAPKQLSLTTTNDVSKALSEVIKPGMTKEAAAQATLERMAGESKQVAAEMKAFIQKHTEAWFAMEPSQAEIPFRVMGEALKEEGVKLHPVLEAMLEAKPSKIAEASGKSFGDEVAAGAKGITIEEAKSKLPALAERMGIDLDQLKNMTPGGRFDPKNPWYANPKKMYGYLVALENRASEIGPLAKAALEGDDAAKLQFAHYMSSLFSSNPDGKIKFGHELTDMLMHWNPEAMAAGDMPVAMASFAKDMAHMADSGKSVGKALFDNQVGALTLGAVPEMWAKGRNLYLNALLPMSWKAAFVGNTYATGGAVMERALGAAFSPQAKGFVDMSAGARQAFWMSKGLMMAQGDAIKAFGNAYRLQGATLGRFAHANPWDSEIGQIINIPMNTVKGMDNYFSAIITRASHYAVAGAEGEQLGLKGTALGNHIQQRIANPTHDMIEQAKTLADTATFQNQLGGWAGQIQKVLQGGPLVFYFPFMKSAINLAKYTWDRTPGLQLLSRQLYMDIAAGGPKADAAVARIVMGQLLGHYYMELAKDGYITGGGPVEPQARRAWELTHAKYSAATGTGWLPLANLEPMNTMPGMISDLVEVVDHLDPLTAEQAMAAVGFAAMRNFTNGTWWQSASSLQDAIQTLGGGTDFTNPSYRFLRSPISAPFQPLAQFARAADPIQRQTRSWIDDIKNKVPIWSKTLPPAVNGVADPIVPPIAFGGSWFGLMRPIVPAFKPYETDPLSKELSRLGVKIPLMNDHLGGKLHEGVNIQEIRPEDRFGIRLSNEDLQIRQQIYRRIIRHPEFGLEAFMNNSDVEYKNDAVFNDSLRRAELERQLNQAWQQSGDALMAQKPELAKRVLESDAKSILAKTPDQEKETTAHDLASGITDVLEESPEQAENLERFGIIGPKQPDNTTYGTPYGPLINIRPVPPGTPGAVKE